MILTQAKASPGPTPVSILRVVLLTDTLNHPKDCGKITEKSLSTYAIAEMLHMILIMTYLNLLITTLFTLGHGFLLFLLQKNIVSNIKHVWLLTQLENANIGRGGEGLVQMGEGH